MTFCTKIRHAQTLYCRIDLAVVGNLKYSILNEAHKYKKKILRRGGISKFMLRKLLNHMDYFCERPGYDQAPGKVYLHISKSDLYNMNMKRQEYVFQLL